MPDTFTSPPFQITLVIIEFLQVKKRIGILGGTFDPIHFGHLRSASDIKDRFGLGKVIFVPSYAQPLKQGENHAGAEHRLEMTRLAVLDNSDFEASDFEVNNQGVSYTVVTLEHFTGIYPECDMYFIMGADSWAEITEWREYRRLFELANLVVTTRPGYKFCPPGEALEVDLASKLLYDGQSYAHPSGNRLWHVEITDVDVIATQIRRRVKEGESITGMSPEKVIDYIVEHELYK